MGHPGGRTHSSRKSRARVRRQQPLVLSNAGVVLDRCEARDERCRVWDVVATTRIKGAPQLLPRQFCTHQGTSCTDPRPHPMDPCHTNRLRRLATRSLGPSRHPRTIRRGSGWPAVVSLVDRKVEREASITNAFRTSVESTGCGGRSGSSMGDCLCDPDNPIKSEHSHYYRWLPSSTPR